ncbi:hypothetical protein [Arthrobacter oryzae]|uniref:Uncharacterized protein n=1 Tax=Arthrobacter oryzae TaxID=409290 RepID=A0A495EVA7_9MICC|nr:hypothetical protein [Arthrobacter oryzae]RKR20722.1 hypothetical protein C8D78_1364 [Arthrobacter oryzae]
MTHIETVAVTAQATFGRDGAMFNGLLGFVAQLSVVLWGLVILTAVFRFVGIRIYRRGGARTRLVGTVQQDGRRSALLGTAAKSGRRSALVRTVAPAATLQTATLPASAVQAAALQASTLQAATLPASAAESARVQASASPLPDAGPVRLGPSTAVEKEVLRTPSELVDVLRTDAATKVTFDEAPQPAEASPAAAAHVKLPYRAPRDRRAEPRSPAHVRAFASHSTEA